MTWNMCSGSYVVSRYELSYHRSYTYVRQDAGEGSSELPERKERSQYKSRRQEEEPLREWKMDRQIDEGDEERDGDGLRPSEITDHRGDPLVSQSVSYIHFWPHYMARPHPDTHHSSFVCVSLPMEPLAGTPDPRRSHVPPTTCLTAAMHVCQIEL